MANSKIKITFFQVPEIGEVINLSESLLNLTFNETFKANRYAPNVVKIPLALSVGTPEDPLIQYAGFTSNNYRTAFNIDFNTTCLFTVETTNGVAGQGLGTVTITANYPNANFSEVLNTTNALIEIDNEVVNEYYITDIAFTPAPNKCNDAIVTITTNRIGIGTTNPISLTKPRGQNFVYESSATDGQSIKEVIIMPSLMPSDFQIQVSNSPFGGTASILMPDINGLTYEYALAGGTYQNSNIFPSLAEGNYVANVRDQFGCVRFRGFVIDNAGIGNFPIFINSKSNSLLFAEVVDFDLVHKTDENTLSCQVDVKQKFQQKIFLNNADIITYQFKTNYSSNIVKADGVNIPVIKMTNNIGRTNSRDAIKYSLGNGKSGIYFISGNEYDYTTNAVNGTYILNGAKPEWAIVGNYFSIDSAWYLIEEIFFDEDKNADVIVLNDNYNGGEIGVIVKSKYNRENFEVYEFTIDMMQFADSEFRVTIESTDPNYEDKKHITEPINLVEKQTGTIEIRYKNSINTDVVFATGIEMLLRVPYTKISGITEEESENYKTDTNVIALSAELYEGDEYLFEPMTKEMWRKVMQALSHDTVFIDGVGRVKAGAFSSESALEQSNLYVLKAVMLKNGNVYSINNVISSGYGESDIELVGFIETDNTGYIRY